MIHIAKSKLKPIAAVRSAGQPKKETAHAPVSLIRKMVAAERLDGRWSTWFGIATLDGRITAEQWRTGVAFADAAAAKERALMSPGCSARAQDISAVGGASTAQENDATIRRHQRAMRRWEEIEAALSNLQLRALDIIVVQMREPEGYVQQMALKAGLDKLTALWKAPRRRR